MIRRTAWCLLIGALALGVAAPALAGTEDDQAIADDTVLTQADVDEYGLTEGDPGTFAPPSDPACKKVLAVYRSAGKLPQAASRFSDQPTLVKDQAVVYKNVKQAKKALAAYASSQGARCVEADFDATLDVILRAGTDYTFDELSPTSADLGDDSVLYQAEVDLSDAEGNTGKIFVELGLIRVGRGVATMQVYRFGNVFDGSQPLAALLTERLEDGLG